MIKLSGISLYNSVAIITLQDNLAHQYMFELEIDNDNSTPVGYAQFSFPYNKEILKYWSTYNGIVVIHCNLVNKEKTNQAINNLPNSSLASKSIKQIKTKKDKHQITIENEEYNYSFIGKIYKVKHRGNKIIIKLNNLGWKFMQKMPMDFRKQYIASQPLGDAFQSMCDFMGVQCAYSKEDLNKYSFAADGYSIEKNGTIIEEVQTIFNELNENKDVDQKLADELDSGTNEAGSLPELSQQNQNQQNQNQQNQTQKNRTQNDTLKSTENNEDIEEFEEKIQTLFNSNTMYNSDIISNVLNYNNIKAQPTTDTNTNTDSDTDINNTSNNNTNEEQNG